MNVTASTPEMEENVRKIVAEALAMDPASLPPTASLIEEMNADSLDFLDIVFKLERAYNIQITRGELERAARGDMSDEEFAPGGLISEAGLARLRELMPEVAARIQPGLRQVQILSLFTVQTFVHLVAGKQQRDSATA